MGSIWLVTGGAVITAQSTGTTDKGLIRANSGPTQQLAVLNSLCILPNNNCLKGLTCSYAKVDF